MENITITVEGISIFDEMVDDDLKTYLCMFNDEDSIPDYWHRSENLIELKLCFDIEGVIDSMIDMHSCLGKGDEKTYFNVKDKPRVEAYKLKLAKCLHKLSSVEYLDFYNEDHE